MVGEFIPANATIDIRIKKFGWIGLYVVLIDAGAEEPRQLATKCLWPRAIHPKSCPRRQAAVTPPAVPRPPVHFQPVSPPSGLGAGDSETAENEARQRAEREAKESDITASINGTLGDLAPYEGPFATASQQFVAKSDLLTYAGVTIGDLNFPAGSSAVTVMLKLCETPTCAGSLLASQEALVNNYGLTSANLGEVPVIEGRTYYLVWTPPAQDDGSPWLAFWHAGSSDIAGSQQMEAVVRGYNTSEGSKYSFKGEITSYIGIQAPPAPRAAPFGSVSQTFVAATNRITKLGVVLGNPKLPREITGPEKVRVSLCGAPHCAGGVLAAVEPYVVNYGVTEATIPAVAVTPGETYFVTWEAPEDVEGEPWLVFWQGSGARPETATQLQAFAKGYDEGSLAFSPTYFLESPEEPKDIETFRNYEEASENGLPIRPAETVEVTCKVFAPAVEWAEPEGYWYRIHSAPWNNEYYAAANEFRNVSGGGEPIPSDPNVPMCS